MKSSKLTLISHHLCPFVQRAAIALAERGVPYERRNIDLANKPDWFLALSPLGKVPVLVVGDRTVLFESSVIAQYVDEITGGHLLSSDTLEKYRQLGWLEYASQVIAAIGRLYSADRRADFDAARADLDDKFRRVEDALGDGPWFAGKHFTLVDAAFAPAFRYFDVIDDLTGLDLFADTPKVTRWRQALSERPSVTNAASDDYPERLLRFFAGRDSFIGRIARTAVAARNVAA